MYCVGLDVHSKRSSLCILDENGKRHKHLEVRGPWPKLMETIDTLPRPFAICFEASCGYGYLHDELARRAACVQVAHPGQLRLIFRSKKKHDRVDAKKLAKLLYLEEVPQVHVPNLDVRGWRKLIEMRQSVVGKRAACKNQVRAVLRAVGHLSAPGRCSLWSKKGRAWLGEQNLTSADRVSLDLLLGQIDLLSVQIKSLTRELDARGRKHPGVQLLMTIPGVGMRTAEAFIAYVDDVKRFSRNKQVGSYFGLVPCQDSSAGVNRLGHITRDGPSTVRKLLCEATHVAIRKSPFVRAWFERVMREEPERKKIAIVAAAHWLTRVMAAMLRTGEIWRHEDKKGRPRSTARLSSPKSASDGGRLSPPEDTEPKTALSSDGGQLN
jgi:transposase